MVWTVMDLFEGIMGRDGRAVILCFDRKYVFYEKICGVSIYNKIIVVTETMGLCQCVTG